VLYDLDALAIFEIFQSVLLISFLQFKLDGGEKQENAHTMNYVLSFIVHYFFSKRNQKMSSALLLSIFVLHFCWRL
jgi:hypothetical protein